MESYEKVCGRCGSDVRVTVEDGRRAEKCVCRVSFDDERVPDCWYYAHKTIKAQ